MGHKYFITDELLIFFGQTILDIFSANSLESTILHELFFIHIFPKEGLRTPPPLRPFVAGLFHTSRCSAGPGSAPHTRPRGPELMENKGTFWKLFIGVYRTYQPAGNKSVSLDGSRFPEVPPTGQGIVSHYKSCPVDAVDKYQYIWQ